MHQRILDFFAGQTSASISCVNEMNEPYSFSCFYVFNANDNLLYYKSSPSSYHSIIIENKPKVSGTVMPDKLDKKAIKGIQFTGEVLSVDDKLCNEASHIYHRKFPIALAIPGVVKTIKLNEIKMTDNFLGIRKKHSWERILSENELLK